jgi:uncharacterized protein DUF5763
MAKTSNSRCKGTTRAGKPCGAPPTQGGLCYFHANPNQARELGRAGGRKNRYLPLPVEVPNVLNTAAANDLICHAIGGLLSNEMDPRHVSALVQLVNCSQRINQHADLEARLEKLEQKANDADSPSDEDPESTGAPSNQLPGVGKYAKKAASQA